MNISAIIMASGLSKRMEKNKLQMEINNKKMYEYILETVKRCYFCETIVVTNDKNIYSKAKCFGFKVLKNSNSHLGQSESIKVALKNSCDSQGYMFFVADQPFVSYSTINLLCDTFEYNQDRIIIPNYNGLNGNPVLFPFSFKSELLSISGDSGGKLVINKNLEKVKTVAINNQYEHMDIDTMEDYEKALKVKELK